MRVLFFLISLFSLPAQAEDKAGDFDYYVLSLSWSPNWCMREGDARNSPQCAADQDFGWILHGLWPQYEDGYPEYCRTTMPPPNRAATGAMADVMGTAGLAWHQWRKHGVCSGLPSADYFALSRKAFNQVTRPQVLRDLSAPVTMPAGLIEEAFLRENPSMRADHLTVTCSDGAIQEVRICLTRELTLRDCASDTRRDCSLSDADFYPIR